MTSFLSYSYLLMLQNIMKPCFSFLYDYPPWLRQSTGLGKKKTISLVFRRNTDIIKHKDVKDSIGIKGPPTWEIAGMPSIMEISMYMMIFKEIKYSLK